MATSRDIKQVAGNPVDTGIGPAGQGTLRVALSNNQVVVISGTVVLGAGAIDIGLVDQGKHGSEPWAVSGTVVVSNIVSVGTHIVNQGLRGSQPWPISGIVVGPLTDTELRAVPVVVKHPTPLPNVPINYPSEVWTAATLSAPYTVDNLDVDTVFGLASAQQPDIISFYGSPDAGVTISPIGVFTISREGYATSPPVPTWSSTVYFLSANGQSSVSLTEIQGGVR